MILWVGVVVVYKIHIRCQNFSDLWGCQNTSSLWGYGEGKNEDKLCGIIHSYLVSGMQVG